MASFTFKPQGPYNLVNQNEYFGGFPTFSDGKTIVLAFPVEGWQTSAAVTISEDGDKFKLEVYGAIGEEEKAREQALATLSLDADGIGWAEVGKRDKHIGELQAKYNFLRPVLFNSPYEAAAHFIIGHRISMKQGRAIRARMSEAYGDKHEINGQQFAAFPGPDRLLDITEFSGLNATKIERLHGIARTALEGQLDREYLRSLTLAEAKQKLLMIEGVGPFFAEGILNRGAGVVDELTDDDLTKFAVMTMYGLSSAPSQAEVLNIANAWKPYRMWAEVLLHVWVRREVGLPKHRFGNRKRS